MDAMDAFILFVQLSKSFRMNFYLHSNQASIEMALGPFQVELEERQC